MGDVSEPTTYKEAFVSPQSNFSINAMQDEMISMSVRSKKFQFLKKWQNRNFGYKIIISVKNPKFIL